MMIKEIILTQGGLKQIEEEMEFLITKKRKEISERIKEALAFGDISENSEYDEAKNEQGEVEARILKLEHKIKYAKIIDESELSNDVVSLGSTIKVLDMEFEEEEVYTIVGATEADPYNNKISNESPVGSALLGKTSGDVVEIQIPDGVTKFKIISIGA